MFKRTTTYILSTNNRKNQNLLDVQIKRNIESGQTYTVTEKTLDVGNNNSTKVLFHKTLFTQRPVTYSKTW